MNHRLQKSVCGPHLEAVDVNLSALAPLIQRSLTFPIRFSSTSSFLSRACIGFSVCGVGDSSVGVSFSSLFLESEAWEEVLLVSLTTVPCSSSCFFASGLCSNCSSKAALLVESMIFFSSSALSISSGVGGLAVSGNALAVVAVSAPLTIEPGTDSPDGSGCCEAVAVGDGVRGLTFAKKLELISPIPIKKSSARRVSEACGVVEIRERYTWNNFNQIRAPFPNVCSVIDYDYH